MKITQSDLRTLVREMIEEETLLPLQKGGKYASTQHMPISLKVGTQFTVEDIQVRDGKQYALLVMTNDHGEVKSFWRDVNDLMGNGKNWLKETE